MAKLYTRKSDGTYVPYNPQSVTNIDVVQTTGNSVTAAMSQDAVTKELATKQDTLTSGNGISIEGGVIGVTAITESESQPDTSLWLNPSEDEETDVTYNRSQVDALLQGIVDSIASLSESGYLFSGVVTSETNPGTPDAKVFYIANGKGTYTNFGGIQVTEDEVVVLYYDTSWHKEATGIASQEKLTELEQELGEKTGDFSAIPMVEDVTIAAASGNYAFVSGAKAFMYPLSGSGKVSFVSIPGVTHNVKLLPSNVVVIGQSANVISNVSPNGTNYDENSKYLYVQIYQGTDRTPAAIYVNGYDILKGVLDNTKSLYQELQKEITSEKIADDAVISAKIADSAVTSAKIENEGVIWEKRTKAGVFGLLVNSYNLVPIQFDTINKTITIPRYTRLICGRKQIPLSPLTEDYTIDISGYANGILAVNGNFNSIKADSIFVASHMSAESLTDLLASENYILVCGWENFGVSCVNSPSAFSVDGKPYGIVQTFKEISHNDYINLVIDKENRIISAIDKTGNNIFFGDVEVKGALKYEVLPQYYLDEKKRIANLLSNDEHDFVIGFFADPHSVEDNRYAKYNDLYNSNILDAIVCLGDVESYSLIGKDKRLVKAEMSRLVNLSGRTQNNFYAIGNHDAAISNPNSGILSEENNLTKREWFEIFIRHLNHSAVFDDANPYGGYYYVDYNASKIRIIVLNTSEIYEEDGTLAKKYVESVIMRQTQIDWFTNKALNFTDKDTPEDWSVIVVGHSKAYNGLISEVLATLKTGGSLSKTYSYQRTLIYTEGSGWSDKDTTIYNNLSVNVDFSQQGAVGVIATFYGHDHLDSVLTSNGIPEIRFICDNSELDNYLVKEMSSLDAGDYCFDYNGKTFYFKVTIPLSGISKIGFNTYHAASLTYAPMRSYDENGYSTQMGNATTTAISGAIKLDFSQSERVANTITAESGRIVAINKETKQIKIFCYGIQGFKSINY